MASTPPAHPDIAFLAFLLGTWRGDGTGVYPTIEDFTYEEEITFSHVGRPFLVYHQTTKRTGEGPDAGEPLHTEHGFWRSGGVGRVEAMMAQPTGIVELQEGTVDGTTITLSSTTVGLSATATEVRTLERVIEVEDGGLSYRLLMGAVGQPHQVHLEATLVRAG